ncbi:oligosaccharide flippase family protein [bacterium]|nr:oligosaccharide flippase family protein [bacterium]
MTFAQFRKKIANFESKLISISLFITGVSIVGKLLGFFKVHLIARLFGTSKESDIFYAAFALPDLVFALLVVGTVNAALVPVFIKILRKNEQKTLHTTLNTVIALLFGVLLILLGILYFAMPSITSWIFSSKEVLKAFDLSLSLPQGSSSYYQNLFINLSRLMLVSPLLLAVSSVFGAYLQAHKRFISTALAPLMYNIGIVIGIAYFVKFAPEYGVYALSYSILLGTLLHFITQLIGVFNLHENDFSWSFGINNYVKDIAKLSLPRIFGLGVEQIAIMFNTFWGFTLGTGALSVFKFASTLYLVPVDLITGSFLQVLFPRLNERAHANDGYKSLNRLYWRTLVLLCLIAVPVAISFIVLRLPIVRLIFGAGRFTWTATLITSFTLVFFTPAILLQALAALNIRTFYAINNTKTPLLVSFIGVTCNILFSIGFTNFFSHATQFQSLSALGILDLTQLGEILSWFFTRGPSFGAVAGLAFGITVSLFFEVLLSFWLLSKQTRLWQHVLEDTTPLLQIKKIISSALITLGVTYFVYRVSDMWIDSTRTVGVLAISFLTGVVCLVTYSYLTRKVLKQYFDMKEFLRRKLFLTHSKNE